MNASEIYRHGAELFWAGFLFNIMETWYFGWNIKASCPEEMMCDYVATGLMVAGIMIQVYSTQIKQRLIVVCSKYKDGDCDK